MKKLTRETSQPQQKQQLILGLAIAVLAVIVYYNVFWQSAPAAPVVAKTSEPRAPRISASALKNLNAQSNTPATQSENTASAQPALDLENVPWEQQREVSVDRNIFSYPPPPPPPQEPPPPPPTININSVSPSSVYAQTKPFEMVVRGTKFTSDMRIYLNGSPVFGLTTFVSENELRAPVAQQYFNSAQQMNIEVRTPGNEAKFFSNRLTLSVLQPPAPRFTMVGQISDSNGQNPRAVLIDGNNRFIVSVDERIKGTNFKVVSINNNTMMVEDVVSAIGVKHPVSMKVNANTASNGAAFSQAVYQPVQQIPEQPQVSAEVDQTHGGSEPAEQATGVANPNQQQMEEIIKRREEFIRRRNEILQQRGQGNQAVPNTFGVSPGLIQRPRQSR
ncbi:MAG: hypothetical protein AB1489_02185 [Acidobacteriota bacterium]